MSAHPVLVPKPHHPPPQPFPTQDSDASLQPSLSEADIDRFATLFSPATPPATPTLTATVQLPPIDGPTTRARKSTQGSADSDFGAFVSVPPSQDPLLHPTSDAPPGPPPLPPPPSHPNNLSLGYFDQFTAHAKFAAERNRREVLDELLQHQDDPMYFLDTHSTSSPAPTPALDFLCSPDPDDSDGVWREHQSWPESLTGARPASTASEWERVAPIDILPDRIEYVASDVLSPSAPCFDFDIDIRVASSTRDTLAYLLESGVVVAVRPSPLSSAYVRPCVRTHHHLPIFFPFCKYRRFAGDRAWDRGFSEVLEQEEKRGLVDPIGLGLGIGTEMTAHTRYGKAKGVILVGRREGTVRVLSEEIADLLRPHLPALTKLPRHWTLLYSLDQHGISLNTLYARCEPRIPSRAHPNPPKGGLLVIQDAHDAVFGAWLSEGVKLEKGGYYGSGESFLWRYHPPLEGERQGRLDVYTWTGTNEYVSLCEPGFISFGGGDGHFGLYLDASLLDGSSAPCPTFGNPPLCASAPHVSKEQNGVVKAKGDVSFECVGLEVWGIGQG
ncbi:TLD-domain-containing protein [Butyriboletus roseoflavus]|nr:TLD-domain-containing protein [Butyriboletus roseoflavus]